MGAAKRRRQVFGTGGSLRHGSSTKELEAAYTSSWFEESLSPSKVLSDGYWHIDIDTINDVHHTPIDNSQVDVDTAANAANMYMINKTLE